MTLLKRDAIQATVGYDLGSATVTAVSAMGALGGSVASFRFLCRLDCLPGRLPRDLLGWAGQLLLYSY
jgi:hypothetical protein